MRRLSLAILLVALMSTVAGALELTCKGNADFDAYTIKLSFVDTGQPDLWGKVTVLRGKDVLLEDGNAVMDEVKTVQIRGKFRDTGEQVFILLRLDSDLKTGEAVLQNKGSDGGEPFGSYTCKTSELLSAS